MPKSPGERFCQILLIFFFKIKRQVKFEIGKSRQRGLS